MEQPQPPPQQQAQQQHHYAHPEPSTLTAQQPPQQQHDLQQQQQQPQHHYVYPQGTSALQAAAAAIDYADNSKLHYADPAAAEQQPDQMCHPLAQAPANSNATEAPQQQQAAARATIEQAAIWQLPPEQQPQQPQGYSPLLPEQQQRKRRLCKFPGCTKVVKSQGHCQAHGAKAKRCSVEGCDKQAQTTHEGMCKRHWKLKNFPDHQKPNAGGNSSHSTATSGVLAHNENPDDQPKKSVYETVLPQSIAFRPMAAAKAQEKSQSDIKLNGGTHRDPLDPPAAPEGAIVMPLVAYLQEGASKEFGWHRNEEREARGVKHTTNLSAQLEGWERQLAVVEILLLGGGTPYASFKNLAHGWGRQKGFHSALINDVCNQRGDMIRKRKIEVAAGVHDTSKIQAVCPVAAPPPPQPIAMLPPAPGPAPPAPPPPPPPNGMHQHPPNNVL